MLSALDLTRPDRLESTRLQRRHLTERWSVPPTYPQPAGHKDQVYSCDQCGHEANVTVDLKKHKAEVHKNSAYTCNQCGLEDAGTASLKKHKKQSYNDSAYSCGQCQAEANSTDEEEQQEEQEEQDEEEEGDGWM